MACSAHADQSIMANIQVNVCTSFPTTTMIGTQRNSVGALETITKERF